MFKKSILAATALVAFTVSVFAQMQSGSQMQNFSTVFGVSDPAATHFTVSYLGCTSPANILFPGEQPEFRFQIHNTSNQQLVADGKAVLLSFGTKGIPGDIWLPSVYANGELKSQPIHVDIPANGSQEVKVKFDIPEDKGGYGVVIDLGSNGRQFGTSVARTFPPEAGNIPYPKMLLDSSLGLDALDRLGVRTVRREWGFSPNDPDNLENLDKYMKELSDHHITVLLVFETGPKAKQPMGLEVRRWLGDDDVTLEGGNDRVWMPEDDEAFQKYVANVAGKYGWPKGPITGVSLWNEPWEGISISGWGSDIIRYRTLFAAMGRGVEEARKNGTNVLVTGCDSSTNSWDKLFCDGKDDYLKWFDACTIHYQGIAAPSLYKMWLNRKGPNGRVQIWDTESWVANTDDRVATIVATDRAAGYDRGMGVFYGNVTTKLDSTVKQADGTDQQITAYHAWPLAASVGAVQHFIGEREFKELLFKKGLPWVFVFNGLKDNADDGTVVIAGDLGEVLGENSFPFRTVRGLKEVQEKEDIRTKLASLPANAPERSALQKQLDTPGVMGGGLLTMPALPYAQVYDFYGNPLPLVDGKIQVPLDFRGYYLRTDGSAGSFAKVLEALEAAHIDGYEPLEVVAHDALEPLAKGGAFKLTLSNILNRPIHGNLKAEVPGLQVDAPADLSFGPYETKEVLLKVSGTLPDGNAYPLHLAFDAGSDGKVIYNETLHVNFIAKRTVKVDGDLADWKGVLPQGVVAKGTGAPSLTEAAWLPFKDFPKDLKAGLATSYMAYDDHYFYFAAKVAENHTDDGTFRFEKLDADQFFYPDVSYEIDPSKTLEPLATDWTPSNADALLRVSADDPAGRDKKIWQNVGCVGLGFIIEAPTDKASQVALYLANPPGVQDGIVVQIVNQQTGQIVVKKEVENSPNGVYAIFNLKGKFHITIRGTKGGQVGLGGIFLDTPAMQNLSADAPAEFVELDSKTHGAWPNKFGKNGLWLAGSPSKLPGDFTVQGGALVEHHWPEGVRHYSYRKDASLPSGTYPAFDNVQLAFNVLPEEKKITITNPPGTIPNFVPGQDTDYEFALNKVADKFGGGTEIWRMRTPELPSKNFYAREPKAPGEGPVKGGKLVVKYGDNTRIVEAAIPWSEIPEVKAAAEAGKTIKFSFRINDSKGVAMELAEDRSVSKTNPHTFHTEWTEHWGNEVEFGFEK